MLEKKYADVRTVMVTTNEFFGTDVRIPEDPPAEWLQDFNKRQLAVAIEKNIILVIRPLFDEIEVGLSHDDFFKREKWENEMKDLKLKGLSFSTSPIIFHGDRVFNLGEAEGEAVVKPEEKIAEQPELKKILKCPNCHHKLTDEEVESGSCDDCSQSFWTCPRCNELIGEDPDGADSCPACKKTYHKVDCPKCNEDVWIDESKCSRCGEKFRFSKCPSCKEKFVVSDQFNDCPFCQADLYICPRCGEYIDEDPDNDADFCPLCKKSFHVVDCPKCRREIFSDVEKCEHCGKELKLGKCPCDDCRQPLVVLSDITECPYCENDIRYVKCPGCQEEFYLEEN